MILLNTSLRDDETLLFHEGESRTLMPAEDADRMTEAGGLILLEEKSDIGNWNMGSFSEIKGCVLGGEYGNSDSALQGL